MLASAGDISLEHVLRIIFGILSGSLILCMLMLSRSFFNPFNAYGYVFNIGVFGM